MHLIIDGYGADYEKMQDVDLVYRFLDECPSSIGMTKITQPHVITYHGPKPEDWGVSGFVIIAESHISVHTFPERGYINIDVFSCKEFDSEAAVQEIRGVFSLSEMKVWTLERGLEYSEPDEALRIMNIERAKLLKGSAWNND
ncbi:MAG: adenosylmethionine decarboxylase [Chloroflexi bacterium]|nr:adenosylmethionine decarboxylase [Chloroflexota bacterium]